MCKQKINIGLLLCSLSFGQAFGIEPQLRQLATRLNDLRGALDDSQVPPVPSRVGEPVFEAPGFELPPPPVPGSSTTPIKIDQLPPSPVLNQAATPNVVPQPPVQRIVSPVVIPVGPAPVAPKPVAPKPLQPVQQNIPPVVQPGLGDGTNKISGAAPQGDATGDLQSKKSMLKNLFGAGDDAGKPAIKLGKQKAQAIQPKSYQLEINMAGNLPPYLDQLKAMPVATVQQKADKKSFARALLNAILSWVQKKQVNKDTVVDAVNTLLNIDPLLISTAELVFEKIGYTQEQIRAVMVQLFKKQVAYIEQRFIDEQASANITAGARDDIDEAVSYPMELLGALRLADNIKLMSERKTDVEYINAEKFLTAVAQQKQRLCAAIQANAHKFDAFPEYLAVYNLYCGRTVKNKVDVYCTTPGCTYGPGIKDVEFTIVDLRTAIDDLVKKIATYRATQVGSEKVMIMQDILGTLSDFNYFFSNPHFCTICLKNAIYATQSKDPLFANGLATVGNFISQVAQQQNNRYLENFVSQAMPAINKVIARVASMPTSEVNAGYQRAKQHWAQFHTK